GSDLVLERRLFLVAEAGRDGGDRAPAAQEAVEGTLAAEVAVERRVVVAGTVAVDPEALPELLREERRDGVVTRVGVAREDASECRTVVGGVRPVLDAAVPPVQRVEELRNVADRVDAVARRAEPVVDDDAASYLESRVARELDVRFDADTRDEQVRGRDLGLLESQVDTVPPIRLVQRVGERGAVERREEPGLAH